jgi:hypothetical protein
MTPVAFDEDNTVLDAPPGVSNAEPLSAYVGDMSDGTPVIISCHKMSAEELAEVNRTGRVWLLVMGRRMPCVALDAFNPWTKNDGNPPERT